MVQYPATVDRAFAALADPTRRAVLERLGSGSATISELAEPFGMSLTGMKKHIRLLEEAQFVTTEKVGRVRRCMLAPYAFEGISMWLQRLDRFAQVRPGGTYRFRTAFGLVEGEFREVDAPERLVQTFQNHLQTLEFEDLGERTKLTQTMRFATTEERDTTMQYGVEEGAKGGFARVDALLQRLPLDA
jgi:DNA-binding transcriptional ArsR family regulator